MSDPILWIHADNANEQGPNAGRRVMRYRGPNGKIIEERVPARCSANDDYGTPSVLTTYERWLPVIRADGNAVRVPLTNAAAHTDTDTTYARHMREKAKHKGWFRFDQCPIAQIHARTVWANAFVSDEVKRAIATNEAPCPTDSVDEQHMCVHAIAEQKARQEARRLDDIAREKSRLDEATKLKAAGDERLAAALEESNRQNQAMIEKLAAASTSSNEQTQELIKGLIAALSQNQRGKGG
mgnify:CR=1 FL=1